MILQGIALLLFVDLPSTAIGFVPKNHLPQHHTTTFVTTKRSNTRHFVAPASIDITNRDAPPITEEQEKNKVDKSLGPTQDEEDRMETGALSAELKYIGPYPCIGMRFPNLATSSQRSKNVTGVSLDFVLDTAANTNTINAQVAQELQLPIIGSALPGVGTSGIIKGGANTYELGDCQLEGILSFPFEKDEVSVEKKLQEEEAANTIKENSPRPFIFMSGLTASALPIASPAAAGLLSSAFLNCFEGGVEFQWGVQQQQQQQQPQKELPPSITFHGADDDQMIMKLEGMHRVSITRLPVTYLPSVTLVVNGVEMRALLDTGSPITVFNTQAAKLAGINTVPLPSLSQETKSPSKNPISGFMNRFKENKEIAEAASRGDVLFIGGAAGERISLIKSDAPATISLQAADKAMEKRGVDKIDKGNDLLFGQRHVYVGNLPGLAALNGLGDTAPPAVVLGMDILRLRPRMLLRLQQNELYF